MLLAIVPNNCFQAHYRATWRPEAFGVRLTNETIHSINISLYNCQFGIRTSRSRAEPAVSHLSDTLPPIDYGFYIALRDAKIFIFQAIKLYHSLCKEWQGSIPLVFLASKIIKIVRKTRRTNVTVKK